MFENSFKNFLLKNINFHSKGVRLGEWDLNSDPDCQDDLCADEVVDIPIAERIVHENYHPHSRDHENDIALLRLNQSVQFTKWIKPLCLPVVSSLRDKEYDDKNVLTIAGWGRVGFYALIRHFLFAQRKKEFSKNFQRANRQCPHDFLLIFTFIIFTGEILFLIMYFPFFYRLR